MKQVKIQNYKFISQETLDEYSSNLKGFDLRKTVRAKLELLSWGKSQNLLLLFSVEDIKFKVSVFHSNGYSSRDKSFSFREVKLVSNKYIDLELSRTKSNYINIMSAKFSDKQ